MNVNVKSAEDEVRESGFIPKREFVVRMREDGKLLEELAAILQVNRERVRELEIQGKVQRTLFTAEYVATEYEKSPFRPPAPRNLKKRLI